LQPFSSEATVKFLPLPHDAWRDFFDGMTAIVRGKQVEIEVVGLDLGDEVQAEWVALTGLTYEPRQNTLFIYTDQLEHSIADPQEISVELGNEGVNQLVILDAQGQQQFVRLRSPLELPAVTGLLAPEAHPSAPR
jgi:hypothetical protein